MNNIHIGDLVYYIKDNEIHTTHITDIYINMQTKGMPILVIETDCTESGLHMIEQSVGAMRRFRSPFYLTEEEAKDNLLPF